MTPRDSNDREEEPHSVHRAEMSGAASEVLQARDVHGGVHFHAAAGHAGPTPQQLPGDIGSFVNRETELERLDGALPNRHDEPTVVGVYVISGTAGVGKTSLALHWAHAVRQRFPDGQLYVNLRGYDPGPQVTAERALEKFLRALGVSAE